MNHLGMLEFKASMAGCFPNWSFMAIALEWLWVMGLLNLGGFGTKRGG